MALMGGVWLLAAAPAGFAMSFAADDFESYSLGSVAGSNGGSGWGGAWTGANGQTIVNTVSNPLSFTVAGGNTIDGGSRALQFTGNSSTMVTRTLGAVETGTVYASYLFRIDGGTVGNNDFASLWFNEPGNNGGPGLGLKSNRGNGSGPEDFFARTQISGSTFYSTEAQVGQTYLIVGKFEKSGANGNLYDRYSLWVNPAATDELTPDGVVNQASGLSDVSSLGWRTVNFSDGLTVTVDSLRLSSTFEDAIGGIPATAVPFDTPGGLGLLLAALYVWRKVHRRRQAVRPS